MVPDTAGYIVVGIVILCFLVVLFFFKIILESKNRKYVTQENATSKNQNKSMLSDSTISNLPEVSGLRISIFLVIEIILFFTCLNIAIIFARNYRSGGVWIWILMAAYIIFVYVTLFILQYFLFSKLPFQLWPTRYKVIFFITTLLPLLGGFM